jgi:hypothetical protein
MLKQRVAQKIGKAEVQGSLRCLPNCILLYSSETETSLFFLFILRLITNMYTTLSKIKHEVNNQF